MLALTLKPGESVFIGEDIQVKIVDSTPGRIKIAIDAPKELVILREKHRREEEFDGFI